MLFNSYPFICLFLPITLWGFWLLSRNNPSLVPLWLAAASLFFYGWWNPTYLVLLISSISANYFAGYTIDRQVGKIKQVLIGICVGANLALLGYYKYTNFFISNLDHLIGNNWTINPIILPLGISFFTFTQIAFLVDVYQGKVKEYNFVNYLLFVTYFPHLIAGPVLHHQDMMPQFKPSNIKYHPPQVATGLIILAIGLIKKVLLADGIVNYVSVIFEAVREHIQITFAEAWLGALAYTLQLYFDFSGYSDMAIGISLLFGIKLPINFNSPYKATNIIEFWRRWHITLSNFLRDYLYIPLGGNRKGKFRRYLNLFVTMILGGLWHGAGWTFIIWGGLHGLYLIINYGWRGLRESWGHSLMEVSLTGRILSTFITFIAVTIAWVFFRAQTLSSAIEMSSTMLTIPTTLTDLSLNLLQNPSEAIMWIMILLTITFCFPNTQEIINHQIIFSEFVKVQPRDRYIGKIASSKLFLSKLIKSKTQSRSIYIDLSYISIHEFLANQERNYLAIGIITPLILMLIVISESQAVKEFIYFNF